MNAHTRRELRVVIFFKTDCSGTIRVENRRWKDFELGGKGEGWWFDGKLHAKEESGNLLLDVVRLLASEGHRDARVFMTTTASKSMRREGMTTDEDIVDIPADLEGLELVTDDRCRRCGRLLVLAVSKMPPYSYRGKTDAQNQARWRSEGERWEKGAYALGWRPTERGSILWVCPACAKEAGLA